MWYETKKSTSKPAGRTGSKPLNRSSSEIALLGGLAGLVCVAVLIVHWLALSSDVQSFDDTQYLTENPLVQNPSWSSARRFLAEVLEPSTVEGYYQPLTMISLMADYALGGRDDNLMPFHRTSLALHMMNTTLVIVLLYLLFGHAWVAAGVGLLFGLHPMTVEPVCWLSDRKTLLAAFFALWSLIFYVRFTRQKDWKFYIGCVVAYILALMSKPTSVPLPVLLLLLDFWPLRRLKKKAILEKIPLFVIGGIAAVITYISQSRSAAVALPSDYGLQRIPLTLCHNIVFYLHKIIWPANLSSHYAFPMPMGLSEPMVALGIVGTCILIPLFVISLRRTRGLLTGWLFFFLAMLPTMQIIGFSEVIAADKFAYLPSVGLLMVLTSFLVWLIGSSKVRAKFAVRISVVTVIVLALAGTEAVATRRQLTHWRDTAGYYEHMLTLTPGAAVLHYGLGIELQSQGKIDEAINRYRRAIEIRPYYAEAHYNLATALKSQENIDEAMSHYRQAIRIKPDYAQAHYNLAMALESQGELDKAISCYYEALKYRPDDIESHNNVGIIFVSQGRFDDAINHFRRALQARPDDAKSHFNLGIALKSQGKLDKAIEHFLQALQTNPNFAEAHNHLGIVLAKTGRLNGALKHFQEALRLRPDWPVPLIGIARILALHPDPKVRDTDRAVSFAERADGLTKNKNPAVLNTLAEVYAAAGRYDSAIATAQTALDLATAAKMNELAERIRRQLEKYRQAKPEEKLYEKRH